MRYFYAASVCLLILSGCPRRDYPATQRPSDYVKPTTTSPTEAHRPPAVMATVNGKPIYMEDLHTPLVESYGLRIAEMLIVNVLVAQEAERTKITVTEKDVLAENNRTLQGILGEQQLTPDQREQVLGRLLKQRGLTRRLWTTIMRRNAILRKMVAGKAVVSEAMIKAEFARLHGEKVQVSHIQLPGLTEAEKIIKLLKAGGDFADLAQRYSTNTATAKDGGALAPFSRENPAIPRAIRDAAFALKTGQISGIVQVGSEFHVLKLYKRFMPPAADYKNVREKLRDNLQKHIVERLQVKKLAELRRKAGVEYINPTLKRAANRPAEM
ncbi:MAG: peptidylprolyl isomerase [Phycisphaerae bacterium]|nr:peptidylprolyl isomerase [Phycisphaerae bacterium]